MSPRQRRRALVVVRDGAAVERGWLALRTALALGLGGYDVAVWLEGRAVALAAGGLDARRWLSADPGAELAGLLEEAGAEVHAQGWPERAAVVRPQAIAAGVSRDGPGASLGELYARADLVVAP